ncbi:MAG: HAD-IB family phosphatase [Gemmatimonadaceae bacterium]
MIRYRSVILDVDSTLCAIEGVDWLAARRGPEVARRVAETTERAMSGEIAMEAVYGDRLALVRPSRRDIEQLAQAYRDSVAPGAREAIHALRAQGVRAVLVSGGLRQAIAPLASELGFTEADLHAVDVRWDEHGEYAGFDETSPLTTQHGKVGVVRSANLPPPALAVGDGATDLAMRPAVAAFAAFTGFVRRDAVVSGADHVCESFAAVRDLVLT